MAHAQAWCSSSAFLYIGEIINYIYFYRPQTKFAKVMFLQVSVCPQGGMHGCSGGACVVAPGGVCMVALGGHAWLLRGGMCSCSRGGMHGCSGGACVVVLGGHVWLLWGGMHGYSRGVRGCSRGACVVARGRVRGIRRRYGDTVNERAVRILLECILVSIIFSNDFNLI